MIVCPASVKFAWVNEVKKWTNMSSVVIDSKTKLHDIDASVNIWIINYDILKRHFSQLTKTKFDLISGDECVIPQTYIATQDGQKQIINLRPGEMVLTYNTKEKIYEYKPIIKIMKKPLHKPLARVGDLVCTDDHKIYDGKKFVKAKNVKGVFNVGFPTIKYGESDEVLAGCLMGDGSLLKNKGATNARLKIGNCLNNYDYINMKCNIIKELNGRQIKKFKNNGYKPSDFFRVESLTNLKFTTIHSKTYKYGKRIVDTKILDMMKTPGLAVWLQDDGSIYHGVINLCTHRYLLNGNKKIKKWFEARYNISPKIIRQKKSDGRIFYFLQINVNDSMEIYKKIKDYIVPSMRYKFISLENRFNKIHTNVCVVCEQRMFGMHEKKQNGVSRQKFCDTCRKKYGTGVSYYFKKNIKKIVPYDCVYDLEIKDNHNFFADGILVHNCHMLKSIQAQRTKAFRQISRNIPHVILLSGTPLLSAPIELFSLLNIIDPAQWNNYYDYARKFCAAKQTRFGLDVSGVSNAEELHTRIRGYFLRRTKEEVLPQLPPKNRIEVPVELDPAIIKEYNTAESNFVSYMKQYSGKQPPEIAKTLQAEKLAQLNVLRMLGAKGKVKTAAEIIESIIDSGEKIIVFSSFIEPLKTLYEIFSKESVILTGETPVDERGEIVRSFQEDKEIKIFFGGIKSAGVGITLTAASSTLFLDFSWVPSDMLQAEDRAHRIGSKYESLNIYQLHAQGTIDDDMKELLSKKQEIFDAIIDGKAKGIQQKALDLVADRIIKKHQ